MTLREVTISLKAIAQRKKKEIELKAAFFGVGPKNTDEKFIGSSELTKEQEDSLQRIAEERMKERGFKHVRNNN